MEFGENEYMTGRIQIGGMEYPIAIHQNSFKNNGKQPDVRITAITDPETGEWQKVGAAWLKEKQ